MGHNPTEDALIAGIDLESAHGRQRRADRAERLRKRQHRPADSPKHGGGEPHSDDGSSGHAPSSARESAGFPVAPV